MSKYNVKLIKGEFTVQQLKPGDVVIVRLSQSGLPEEVLNRFHADLARMLPQGVNCIIMQKGADIEVMKHPASAEPAGCQVCGLGKDMTPTGYVCPRGDCPTASRATA